MPKKLFINVGFITNSSSVVHYYPKAILEDPEVRAFMEAYSIQDGYVGEDLWHREYCESLLLTKEQKLKEKAKFAEGTYEGTPYRHPPVDPENDEVVLIYGDEYQCITSELCDVLGRACKRLGLAGGGGDDYN